MVVRRYDTVYTRSYNKTGIIITHAKEIPVFGFFFFFFNLNYYITQERNRHNGTASLHKWVDGSLYIFILTRYFALREIGEKKILCSPPIIVVHTLFQRHYNVTYECPCVMFIEMPAKRKLWGTQVKCFKNMKSSMEHAIM